MTDLKDLQSFSLEALQAELKRREDIIRAEEQARLVEEAEIRRLEEKAKQMVHQAAEERLSEMERSINKLTSDIAELCDKHDLVADLNLFSASYSKSEGWKNSSSYGC